MTREEAIIQLKAIADEQDEEKEPSGYVNCGKARMNADEILLDLINDDEVTFAYRKITKWYF